jgi:hypothetical protein
MDDSAFECGEESMNEPVPSESRSLRSMHW